MPRLSPSSKHHAQNPGSCAVAPETVPPPASAGAATGNGPPEPDPPAPPSSLTTPATRTPAAATIATTARHDVVPRSLPVQSSTS